MPWLWLCHGARWPRRGPCLAPLAVSPRASCRGRAARRAGRQPHRLGRCHRTPAAAAATAAIAAAAAAATSASAVAAAAAATAASTAAASTAAVAAECRSCPRAHTTPAAVQRRGAPRLRWRGRTPSACRGLPASRAGLVLTARTGCGRCGGGSGRRRTPGRRSACCGRSSGHS